MRTTTILRGLLTLFPALLAACASHVDEGAAEDSAFAQGAATDLWELDHYGRASQTIVNGMSMLPQSNVVFWADATDPNSQPKLKWTALDGISREPCTLNLPTAIFQGPSAVRTSDPNVARVFYGDWEGKLWYVDQNIQFPDVCVARPNAAAQLLSGGPLMTSDPAAIWRGGDGYDVFYRGTNGHLLQSQHLQGAQWWGAPIDLGTPITNSPTAIYRPGSKNINVYYRTATGMLGERWWNGSAWAYVGDHGFAILGSPSATVSADEQRVDVFYLYGRSILPKPIGSQRQAILVQHGVAQTSWIAGSGWSPGVVHAQQLNAPLAAWDANHVVAADGSGGIATLAPRWARTTRKVIFNTASASYAFDFAQTRSSSTAAADMPPDLVNGKATSAVVQGDGHAQVMIFNRDSALPGMRPESIWDSGIAPPRFAELPYTQSIDNGPDQSVSLAQWNYAAPPPIDTVRVYDHGECWAHVDYAQFGDAFFATFVGSPGHPEQGQLTECAGHSFDITAGVGPILSTPPNGLGAPAGAAIGDQMFWELSVHGNPYVKILGVCDSFGLGLDTRVTTQLFVTPAPNAPPGATRVTVGNLQLFDGSALGKQAPGFDENQINGKLTSDLPKNVSDTINQSFVIPQGGAWALARVPLPITKDNLDKLPTCTTNADCGGNAGPEDGCYFPTEKAPLSPAIVAWDTNKQLSDDHTGVCINRLEPKRVNVTPRGVDIVLAESTRDPQHAALTLLAQGGGAIQCVKAPTAVNPVTTLAYETMQTERYQKHVE